MTTPASVLKFWFEELTAADHFRKSDELDATIRSRFASVNASLAGDALPDDSPWMEGPDSLLAAIIVLDQFSRNLFRGSPDAFANDAKALSLAKLCIERGWDQKITAGRNFVYLPFMHSETLADQERCVELFSTLEGENSELWAVKHKVIIERFGRFPHRNETLGRASTPEELKFLKGPDSSF